MKQAMSWLIMACVLLPQGANAQRVNFAEHTMTTGYKYTFTQRSDALYKHLAYRMSIPKNTIAIIGVKTIDGSGDIDVGVTRSISPGTYRHANISSFIAGSAEEAGETELVIFHSDNSSSPYYLYLQSLDSRYAKVEVRMKLFNVWEEIGEALGMAVVQTVFECFVTNCTSGPSTDAEKAAGQALGLIVAGVTSDSFCSFGVSALANEVQAKVTEEFPGSEFIATVVNNFATSFFSKAADVTCSI